MVNTEEVVLNVLSMETSIKKEDIKPEHKIVDDLEIDSFGGFQIVTILEEKLNVEFWSEDFKNKDITVQQLTQLVKDRQGE